MFKILLQIRSVIYNCQAINIIYLHSGTTAILIRKYTFGSITKNFVFPPNEGVNLLYWLHLHISRNVR